MKFNVTNIEFDFDEFGDGNPEWQLSQDDQYQTTYDSLGVWDADDEDDLIEEITTASGWCIKSIDYKIQLKGDFI
jgi:hypothetical protein